MKNVMIAGGTGMIGRSLYSAFKERARVTRFSRQNALKLIYQIVMRFLHL